MYSNRARLRVGSYDKNILKKIHKKLLSLKIHNIHKIETLAGTNNQNKDFWRVSVNRKDDILNLFGLIKPHLKHAKRCKDLKNAEENILTRLNKSKEKLK